MLKRVLEVQEGMVVSSSQDDIVKTMKKTLQDIKKSTPIESKKKSLIDILELTKVLLKDNGIGTDDFFKELETVRKTEGTFEFKVLK